MNTIEIKAGERKRIISKFSNSVELTFHFTAETVGEDDLSGVVEVKGSNWLFPKKSALQDLKDNNSVNKGMWDTIYRVYVIPDSDVKISMQGSRLNQTWMYLSIMVLIIVAAAGLIILTAG